MYQETIISFVFVILHLTYLVRSVDVPSSGGLSIILNNYAIVQIRITGTGTPQLQVETLTPSPKIASHASSKPEPTAERSRPIEPPLHTLNDRLCRADSFAEDLGFGTAYDDVTSTCYSVGSRGPCGDSAIFHKQYENSESGNCDCITDDGGRIQVFNVTTRSCSAVLTQAYCNDDEWLTLERIGGFPVCRQNPCVNVTRLPDPLGNDIILYNGQGTELYSKCSNSGGVGYVAFKQGYINARCYFTTDSDGNAIQMIGPVFSGAPDYVLQCKPGSYLAVTGKCRPVIY